ncbi:MAG: cytochrome P450 [Candidatus Binatia bacterium]
MIDLGVDLYDPRTYLAGLPRDAFARLRREAPVYWQEERAILDWPAGRGYWAITRYADVDFVNRNPRLFSSHLGATQIRDPKPDDLEFQQKMMLNMDPPAHSRLRRIVSKAFTPKSVGQLESGIRERVRAVVDRVAGEGRCDFPQDLSADLPLWTLGDVMGVPGDDRKLLFHWANRVIGFQDPEYAQYDEHGKPIDPRSRRALADMFEYAHRLADEKRRRPGADLLTALLFADADGEAVTDEEFENFFFLLSVAGNETLRNSIPGGMLALIEHPDEHGRLLADPSLLPSAIEEMLRFVSPVMCFRRTAAADTELHGVKIHAGDKVVVYYASANHDESTFLEPHRFDVARTPNDHLGFGIGPHFCLGAFLARLQMRVFFEELLWRLPDLALDGEIERLQSNFQSGIKHMPVRFTPERR